MKAKVRNDIAKGRYRLDERLPSERELAALYGVNRLTVNRALTELVQEQWLYRVNGKGTFVSNLYHTRLQEQRVCRIDIVVLSLRRMIDVTLSHYALKLFREQQHFECMVHDIDVDPEAEYSLLRKLLDDPERRIVLTGLCNMRTLKLIRENPSRFLLLWSMPEISGSVAIIETDFDAGGRLAMRHLLDHGHRRIAFCGYRPAADIPGRHHAWRQSLVERGLPAPDAYAVTTRTYDHDSVAKQRQFIVGAIDALLGLPEPPTAVFCGGDVVAISMIHHLSRRGVRIPDDLSIVGFDGIASDLRESLELTTVRQPFEEIFEAALRVLREQAPRRFPHVVLAPKLFPGQTVKHADACPGDAAPEPNVRDREALVT